MGYVDGGATGIRTLETVSRLHTFQACAFDHSATAPTGTLLAFKALNTQEARRIFFRRASIFRPCQRDEDQYRPQTGRRMLRTRL